MIIKRFLLSFFAITCLLSSCYKSIPISKIESNNPSSTCYSSSLDLTSNLLEEYCLIVFDSFGGSIVESQSVKKGNKVQKPSDPSKYGFQFVNWTYNGKDWDFDKTVVTNPMTLAAKWEICNGALIVGGNGDYSTISSAILAANDNDVIVITNGIYEEQVNNLNKCVHIAGESRSGVIWKFPNTNYGLSPYECGMGSIRNLTILAYDNGSISDNRSYCIHLDHFAHYESHPPMSNYFFCENVRMINDCNEVIGIGMRPNFVAEFVNCVFETISGDEACFYVHASTSSTTTNAKCILTNCTITNNSLAGQKGSLRIEGYNMTHGGCIALFKNNNCINLGGGPSFMLHNRTTIYNNWSDQNDWLLDSESSRNNIDSINSK